MRGMELTNLGWARRFLGTEAPPLFHQDGALCQQVGPPVCGLDLVPYDVCQRRLGYLTGVFGGVRHSIAERRSEAVDGDVPPFHPAK